VDTTLARRHGRRSEETGARRSEDVGSLHRMYAATRAPEAREQLTRHYTGYAVDLARRFHNGSEPLEDLVQAAMEGFLRALERFDPDRGSPFPAFATPTIVGALRHHIRDCCYGMRIPRRVHESLPAVRWATERLTAEQGRAPLSSEVADLLGIAERDVDEVTQSVSARAVVSLERPISADGSTAGDRLGQRDSRLERMVDQIAVAGAVRELSSSERRLIRLVYHEGLSQRQIAEQLGVTQMTVSRRIGRTLARLRRLVTA
jgi:RNA polymerase sigma-B factor